MSGTQWTADDNFQRLERGSNWTWALGGLLLLCLSGGLLFFYLAGSGETPAKTISSLSSGQIVAAVGLLGLVLIFFLYSFQKQRSIAAMRFELIQRQMQEESLRSRLSELSVLFDVSGQANLQLEQGALLDLITRRVLTCLEADRSSIFLRDEKKEELVCRAAAGSNVDQVREARVKIGEGISGWVAQNNEPLVLNDDETVRKFATEIRPGRGITTALCVPLATGGKVIGVLNLSRIEGEQPFTAADARLLTIFAEHAASAITRIRQYEALDQKAELLHQANQTLARLNRSKQVFLATVNHELKGPLTIILAYAEFLARNESALDVARRQSFATILYEQAKRLQGITGQILNISRLEDVNIQLDRADHSINSLVAELAKEVEEEATSKAITVRTSLDPKAPKLSIDRDLFVQAFRMLLTNAIAAAETGTEITLSTRAEPDLLGIELRGSGIQVSPEESERVFNLFDGSSQPAQSLIDGLGLGLYLVKRVIELHGGKVIARAIEPRGCSFSAALPMDEGSQDSGDVTETGSGEKNSEEPSDGATKVA